MKDTEQEPTSLALFADRYEYRKELGRGATGRVLLVWDRFEQAPRALKVVQGSIRARLEWEFSVLRSLVHPSLARVYELLGVSERVGAPFHFSAGSAVLIEEFVDGPGARPFVAEQEGVQRIRSALRIVQDTTSALMLLHSEGLVHGDIKPDNIRIRKRCLRGPS